MRLEIAIHDSWASVPVALSRLLIALKALEQPRQPGDDGEDLAELLDSIHTPEPAPAAELARSPGPTPKPAPQPAASTPPAAPAFDGTPRTGKGLYRFACNAKCLPRVNAIGKSFNYPRLVSDWTDDQVAAAYAILTTETAANGKAR
jgi:hypothetical protein